jgi:hypothetical protein
MVESNYKAFFQGIILRLSITLIAGKNCLQGLPFDKEL